MKGEKWNNCNSIINKIYLKIHILHKSKKERFGHRYRHTHREDHMNTHMEKMVV